MAAITGLMWIFKSERERERDCCFVLCVLRACARQIVVSCQWTWLRRRYLWNCRKREWWFTGCFPCVSTPPHPESWGPDQTTVVPTAASGPHLSNVHSIRYDLWDRACHHYQRWDIATQAVSACEHNYLPPKHFLLRWETFGITEGCCHVPWKINDLFWAQLRFGN